jgi:uncharacterized membrane protein YesL
MATLHIDFAINATLGRGLVQPPSPTFFSTLLYNTPLVFSVAAIIFLSMFPWAVGYKLCCYQYLTGKVMILFGILSILYELRGGDSRNLSFTTALIAILLSNVIKGRDDDEWVTRDIKSTYTAVLAFLVAVVSLYFSHLSVPYELERKPDVEQGN